MMNLINQTKINFAFFGTPHLAVEILERLEAAGYLPTVVVSMPDKPQGRGMEMRETPVAAWARARNIDCLKPEKLDSAFIDAFKQRTIAFAVVVAYGKILPQLLLDSVPMYNIHYSLLPRWRGATPVESAILAGDPETGVAIQRIVFELDAGPILALDKTEIGVNETTPELRARLNAIAAESLVSLMPTLAAGNPKSEAQDESAATSCGKMTKEDGLLDLSDPGVTNDRKFRAYAQWPRTYAFFVRGGKRMRAIITKAHLERDTFVIDAIKPEGKGEMPYADFIRSGAKPV